VVAQHGRERASEQLLTSGGLAAAGLILGNQDDPKHQLLLAALGVGTQVGITLPFTRTQESEADTIGLDLMAKAGFDPREAITLWHNMSAAEGGGPPEFLSDHPSNDKRIQALEERLPEAIKESQASGKHPNCGAPP
jgi:predicted Zn-dependent protease